MVEAAGRIREALADGPRSVKELGELGAGFVGNLGLWIDLVRVPPSGTWERRRADRLALAEDWVGPPDSTEDEGLTHLVHAYLRAFGPSTWRDIASWAGITATDAKRGGEGLDADVLPGRGGPTTRRPAGRSTARPGDAGAGAVPPALGCEPAGPRATDRAATRGVSTAGVQHRNPFSVGTYLVDGVVAGAWSAKDGRIVLDPSRTSRRGTGRRWNVNARRWRRSAPDRTARRYRRLRSSRCRYPQPSSWS